jgi:peptide chain release factor
MNDRIMIQISSGQGPDECELAVRLLFEALCREFPDIELIDKSLGRHNGCYKSVRFYADKGLAELEGSVQWIATSPFRPKHKRKNWFVDVSICASWEELSIDERMIRFETFRSSGKGGQHVNKTESGIRAIYEPTGDSAVSTDERSQYRNKELASERLKKIITVRNQASAGDVKNQNWLENYKIVRGNAKRVYEGLEFKRRR